MIALAAEPIFHIGNFAVTNTVINTIMVDAILIGGALYIKKNLKLIPGYFQSAIEALMEMIYNLTESVAGDRAKKIFPYFMSFFLFILVANWTGLLPVFTSIGIYEHHGHDTVLVPFMRSASTDLNVTLALALVSIIATHSMSITTLGIKEYLSRFFSFNPFNLFIGLLELVSEFTKVISFSFRLFGNIFVGEVMLAQLSTAFAFLLPIPLIMYELAVGVIQAVIFGMLTMAFMAILTTPHHQEAKEVSH